MHYFSDSKDHALLAMVVQESRGLISGENARLGRTFIQKIMFFAKCAGIPMRYKFDMYLYGPFCQEILMDMEWLVADTVIQDNSDEREKRSDYFPDVRMDEYLRRFPEVEAHRESVKRLAEIFAPLSPDQLEMASTLYFIFCRQRAAKGVVVSKEGIIDEFQKVKKNKFTRAGVEKMYNAMHSMNFFME